MEQAGRGLIFFLVFWISYDTYKRGAQCRWDTGEMAGILGGERIMIEFMKEVIETILGTAIEILGDEMEGVTEKAWIWVTGGRKKR